MKILHIIDHMGLGGAQTLVKGIVEQSNLNNRSCCYVLRKKCTHNLDADFVFMNTESKYNLSSIFALKEIIATHDIRILHCHLPKAFLIGFLLKTLYFKEIKLIFHEHGSIFLRGTIYRRFLNFTQNKVDLFIAISEATQKKLVQNAKIQEKKIQVIPNFVDTRQFNVQNLNAFNKEDEKRRFGIESTDYVVGFAARIVENKGWQELLFAISRLKNKNIRLLIAGTGPDEGRLLHMINDLHLDDYVEYIGFVDDIVRFYSCIDFFIIPSHREPFGLTALEAQACGIPVLASNVEGLNEVVEDKKTGLLFEQGNARDIAEKICFLIENTDLKVNLIRKGLDNAHNHSLQKYINKLEKMYMEIANE